MLVIIGVLLAFTLLVLFVPVRYRISAVFPGNNIIAKFHWLAGIVSLKIRYPADDNQAYSFRIFGIPFNWLFGRFIRDTDDRDADNNRQDEPEKTGRQKTGRKKPESKKPGKIPDTHNSESEKNESEKNESKKNESEKSESEKTCIQKKGRTGKTKISNIGVQVKKVIDVIKKIVSAIQDPDNIAVVKVIKDRLILLLKHLKPKKIYANMIIGTGDPCNTGLLFGGISILTGLWPGDYTLVPDFDNKVIEGNIYCKGRVRVSVLLYHIIKIMLDDTVKKAWRHTSKGKRHKAGNGGNR